MKAILRVEAIGKDMVDAMYLERRKYGAALGSSVANLTFYWPARYWCAEVLTADSHQRLRARYDYSRANSVGSRGVYACYELDSAHLYEVSSPQSWARTTQFFCTVTDDGDIRRLSPEEVAEWLRRRSPDTTSE